MSGFVDGPILRICKLTFSTDEQFQTPLRHAEPPRYSIGITLRELLGYYQNAHKFRHKLTPELSALLVQRTKGTAPTPYARTAKVEIG